MNNLNFYKEDTKWYITLPEWEGDKADLEMVWGANELLDIVSKYTDSVSCSFSTKPFEGSNMLERRCICAEEDLQCQGGPSEGAYYFIKTYNDLEINLSLLLLRP